MLHQNVVFLSVLTEEVPYVPRPERVVIEDLAEGFWQIVLNYGFMEDVDVPRVYRDGNDLTVGPRRSCV